MMTTTNCIYSYHIFCKSSSSNWKKKHSIIIVIFFPSSPLSSLLSDFSSKYLFTDPSLHIHFIHAMCADVIFVCVTACAPCKRTTRSHTLYFSVATLTERFLTYLILRSIGKHEKISGWNRTASPSPPFFTSLSGNITFNVFFFIYKNQEWTSYFLGRCTSFLFFFSLSFF